MSHKNSGKSERVYAITFMYNQLFPQKALRYVSWRNGRAMACGVVLGKLE